MQGALQRLAEQAKKDYERPWYPGMKKTDAELLYNYILELQRELRRANEKVTEYGWIINPDRMGQ